MPTSDDTDDSAPGVTILQVLEARRAAKGLPNTGFYADEDFTAQGLSMLGGCSGCGESLAAYNAFPSHSGVWACRDCVSEPYATVEDFEADHG